MTEPQVENKIVENAQIPPQKTETVASPEQHEETPQQIDWKRFKEARKLERQQKEEAEKRASTKTAEAEALKAAMEALLNKPNMSSSSVSNTEETEDERIQKKIDQALANERKRVEQLHREREEKEIPSRLQQMFPDFEQVCSDENKDYLKFHHPEVYEAFDKMPHSLDTYATIYKGMKKLIPNTHDQKDQKKAEKNMMKPKSMSVAGAAQTGDSAPTKMLDEQRKKSNWQRMQQRMKGIA